VVDKTKYDLHASLFVPDDDEEDGEDEDDYYDEPVKLFRVLSFCPKSIGRMSFTEYIMGMGSQN
jgi:hypothetical protein